MFDDFPIFALALSLLMSGLEAATISASDSASIFVDSRSGVRRVQSAVGVLPVAWNSCWGGGGAGMESVVLSKDGVEFFRGEGEGVFSLTNLTPGVHNLMLQIVSDGVSQGSPMTTVVEVVDGAGFGVAGLQRATFWGSACDESHIALGEEPLVTQTGAGLYDTTLEEVATLAYSGYMFMTGGESYEFRALYDGFSAVWVDCATVITQHVGEATGQVSFPESGWHRVDFRVSKGDSGATVVPGLGIVFRTSSGGAWRRLEDDGSGTLLRTGPEYCGIEILSAAIRPNDPSVMDIRYKVTSPRDTVSVRALAYEKGNRSFANAVPVHTFRDGTGIFVGDDVAANLEHVLSWEAASDWHASLSKVRVEVMVKEESLLPLHLVTIPKTTQYDSVRYSDTVPNTNSVMNALYWLYASHDEDLVLRDGVLSNQSLELANGNAIVNPKETIGYLYGKMGFSVLEGKDLEYVNSVSRINLTPTGLRQFAVQHLLR